MNKEFVILADKIIKERGKNILLNSKLTKALFMDYSGNGYKKELNLLIKTIELEFPDKIITSDNLDITCKILTKQLIDEHFINDKISNSIVLLLIGLLREKHYLNKINDNIYYEIFKVDNDKKIAIENLMSTLKRIILKKLNINIIIKL